jgi:signal transduction histidine kinase
MGMDLELMGITQDITEDIRVQKQLENLLSKQSELSKMRSDLIHMVTHEFRSPLMVIQNSTERTMRQVDAMNQMLSDITEFAQQGAYRLESGIELVDVTALVTQVLQDTTDADGRSCRLDFQDMGMKTMTNASALKIVLSNLVSNAYKYSMGQQAPVIQTGFSADGEWIEFAVTDYGIGIPESDRPQIFQPFRRGSNVGGLKGLGVGLSITTELVGMLRGTLDLVDLETGMTRFLLRIPTNRM